MSKADKHIVVWVQKFKDRESLMLQWIDPDTGKRKSVSAGTNYKPMAEAKARELEYELNHGLHKEASRMSWEKFRETFEDEYVSGKRQNTRENYKAVFDVFERLCNPTSLRSITERTISQFTAALRKEPGKKKDSTQAASTIRLRLVFLHKALAWAAEQKLIPEIPRFPTVKVLRKKPQPIPAESFERMYAKAPDDNMRTFLLAGWLGGLRLHEATALEREESDSAPWADFAHERIVFPAEFAKSAEDQWIPLDPHLRCSLEALPRRGRKFFHFPGRRGVDMSAGAVGNKVRRLAQKAGVRLSMHSLRKGFGCRYAGRVPAQVLQRLMRHANISLTMTYYANVDAAVMEAVLGPQRNSSATEERIMRDGEAL